MDEPPSNDMTRTTVTTKTPNDVSNSNDTSVVAWNDDDAVDDDDEDDSNPYDHEKEREHILVFERYLYHLLYAGQQLLHIDTEQDDVTGTTKSMEYSTTTTNTTTTTEATTEEDVERQHQEELDYSRNFHAQKLQDFISSRQTNSNSANTPGNSMIPQLMDEIMAVLLQMGELSFVALSSSSSTIQSSRLFQFFLPPRPPDHIYYAHDLRPYTRRTTTTCSDVNDMEEDQVDNEDDDGETEPVDTSYQYRRIDLVRRFLRSMAPIAMDIVARMVERCDTMNQSHDSSHSNSSTAALATFILIGIWLPVAPHILPLVTHFLQLRIPPPELLSRHNDDDADETEPQRQQQRRYQAQHPLYYAKQLWMQAIQDQGATTSLSTPVLPPTSSSAITSMQQICIIMEVTWTICQMYRTQQNSQTMRNLNTWFWEPIFLWLQYDNHTIGVPQHNYYPPDPNIDNTEGIETPTEDRAPTYTSSSSIECHTEVDDAMMVDPPPLASSDEMMGHDRNDNVEHKEDDEVSDCENSDNDDEDRRKFRITREEWTYEIQIMWYVIRIVAYLRRYSPIYTKELMLRYDVYYHHHYVPWHIHDYDMNDEETFYQHIHLIFGYTYLGPYLSHETNQVTLPKIRTVRAFVPLHPYLIHLGRGLLFVKYPLTSISKMTGASVPTMKSNSDFSNSNENNLEMEDVSTFNAAPKPHQQRLIRTSSTRKNMYEIGTIMCVQPPVPILIGGPNGSGKSSLIREIAHEFHSHHSGSEAGVREHQPLFDTPLLEIHVDDETDTKTLVGSYTVTDIPGEFEWRPGALTSAVMSGQWVLFEDFDTVPIDIQASLEPLFKYRTLPLGNGTTITCHPNFRIFGTVTTASSTTATSNNSDVVSAIGSAPAYVDRQANRPNMIVGRGRRLFNAHIWTAVYVDPLPINELKEIGTTKFPNLPLKLLDATLSIFYSLQDDAHQSSSNFLGMKLHDENAQNASITGKKKFWLGRCPSVRDLLKVLSRIAHGIQFERNTSYATESQRVLCLAEIVDIFVAACPNPMIRREFITQMGAPVLNITADLGISYAEHRNPTILLHDSTTEIGRVHIGVTPEQGDARSNSNRFAQTPYSLRLMESIGVCIRENEPTLLVGETGTGKTTVLQHLAKCCGRELIVQNLSLQTDSTDLLGGYRPLEIKNVARNVYQTFVDLFTGTFSRKQNAEFLTFASISLQKEQWTKLSQCFRKAAKLGLAKLKNKIDCTSNTSAWEKFNRTAERFEKQRLACESGLAFSFSEGALVDAIRTGKWVLLDEINLASSETLQRLCGLLDNNSSSLTLTERGDADAVERHSAFRLFAAMNPATDSGKKDLTPSIRARFTELFVDELLDPVQLRIVASQYISGVLPTDERPPEHTDIIITVVDMYLQCRNLADSVLVDGSGQKPRYTLRTLSRALSATNTIVRKQKLPLNRALYEGFHLAFEGPLDEKSLKIVDKLLIRTLNIGSEKSLMDHPGIRPGGRNTENTFELIKPFWIAKGPFVSLDWSIKDEHTGCSRFVLVPSTESNLRRLARAISSGPWPILLEGPTSAGKTTLVEYIAARCGHRVVRINNHEHTDVQEYTGGFAADSAGSLKFVDGILVEALRLGYWVILDELNLAPSEVLEALNRLLDDNRELYIPEINETIKPHERFRLFATQNPSGAYGGRKPLSRAFRNRFVEIQINDIPSFEMTTILEKRCGCPSSHAKCLVAVMDSLRQRRSKSGIFLGKDGLITPRDLLRWANRAASSKYELAVEGYMLLAERLRSREEQQCVREVLEMHLNVKLDIDTFYYGDESEAKVFLQRACDTDALDERIARFIKSVAPTKNLLRLITLVYRCVKKNEPVLLIGETGCGKTVTVQLLSVLLQIPLHTINCHQTTETSDLIGGLRPVRGRKQLLSMIVNLAQQICALLPNKDSLGPIDIPDFIIGDSSVVPPNDAALKIMNFVMALKANETFSKSCDSKLTDRIKKRPKLGDHVNSSDDDTDVWLDICKISKDIERLFHRFNSLFEWADGPLVTAMKNGELILLDEISLADDAVLERLNSVLEPARTIVLAEKGAVDDNNSQYVKAHHTFQLFATMNPGGDFGKRELSPALRSRFTEIWVPPVSDFEDIGLVLEFALARCSLLPSSLASKARILEYVEWFNADVCCDAECSYASLSLSLRDILSWANFLVESRKANSNLGIWEAYCHGARLMHLDGLGLGGGLSIRDANLIRNRAESFMVQQICEENELPAAFSPLTVAITDNLFGVNPFWIPLGNQPVQTNSFNFGAPTTAKNIFRVLRALQVSKPILLEGSPGVGKTTLIGALAESTGHTLVRINLSEQTDMSDLIGSDLPVSDNKDTSSSLGASFRWFDGVLLSAIKNGDWVLLDELNLASQSVLEGLNSCLDHRSSVFVPELGQNFDCPPSFRIFAAQNPMGQGGGRKGLPKSFLNRFTKVYVDSLEYDDLQMIVKSSFPNQNLVDKMVMFNSRVSIASSDGGSLGRLGSPWEFNLRDVFRWCELFAFKSDRRECNPGKSLCHFRFAKDLYLKRFRTAGDRDMVKVIYDDVFDGVLNDVEPPTMLVSGKDISVGDVCVPRKLLTNSSMYEMDDLDLSFPVQLFEPIEAVARCIAMGWPCLLVGKALSGKHTIVRSLAKLTNSNVTEIFLSSSSDVSELVGCFERDDNLDLVVENSSKLIRCADRFLIGRLSLSERDIISIHLFRLEQSLRFIRSQIDEVLSNGLKLANKLLMLRGNGKQNREIEQLMIFFKGLSGNGNGDVSSNAHFSWKDGALVKAMREGHWLHLRNANLCSSSVLDRLNSVLEPRGYLLLAESGLCDNTDNSKLREIKCHPNFRVVLSMNPDHGEVSRAMRNRCVEVSILDRTGTEPVDVLDYCKAFSKSGLRITHLASSVLPPICTNVYGTGISSGLRSLEVKFSVLSALAFRGMQRIKEVLQNYLTWTVLKVEKNSIEHIPQMDEIRNWALFPEFTMIQFWAVMIRAFAGSIRSLSLHGKIPLSTLSLLWKQVINGATTIPNVFSQLIYSRSDTLIRNHLMSLLLAKAVPRMLSKTVFYFEQLSNPVKSSIHFCADVVTRCHNQSYRSDTPVDQSTSEGTGTKQQMNDLLLIMTRIQYRRVPQMFTEQLWLEKAKFAFINNSNYHKMSVMDVSYNSSVGKQKSRVVDCPVTPFLWIFFQCLDDVVQSLFSYVLTQVDDRVYFATAMDDLFIHRDGLWNLLLNLKIVPHQPGRPCFAIGDFIAEWLQLRQAFEKLQLYLSAISNKSDAIQRLDVLIETIEQGIFDYSIKEMLCGSALMKTECSPTVPRQVDAWNLLLKARNIGRMCLIDRQSFSTIYERSMMTIHDCSLRYPVLFVLDQSFKKEFLGMLCTIQMDDMQETSIQSSVMLHRAVRKVPVVLESQLQQLLNRFRSDLSSIHMKRTADSCTFNVEELVDKLARNDSVQEAYITHSESMLRTFADIQIAPCFESWCDGTEADLLRVFCYVLVTDKAKNVHESIASFLGLMKKFVSIAISQPLWELVDLRPYQTIIWLCEGIRLSNINWRSCIKKLMPEILLNVSKRTWLRSLKLYQCTSLLLEVPSIHDVVALNDFSGPGHTEKEVRCSRRTNSQGLTMEFVLSLLHDAFQFEDSQSSRVKFATIENYISREMQACRLVELMSACSSTYQEKPFDVFYLFNEVIMGFGEILPNDILQGLTTFIFDRQPLRDKIYQELLEFGIGQSSSILQKCVRFILLPLLRCLENLWSSDSNSTSSDYALSKIYIGLLRFHLLLPASPIDPGRFPLSQISLIDRRLYTLGAEMAALTLDSTATMGQNFTGNEATARVAAEGKDLFSYKQELERSVIDRPQNGPAFSELYDETLAFSRTHFSFDTVLELQNCISNVALDCEHEALAHQREHNWQSTTEAFSKNLMLKYEEYEDIVVPLLSSVGFVKQGMQLFLESAEKKIDDVLSVVFLSGTFPLCHMSSTSYKLTAILQSGECKSQFRQEFRCALSQSILSQIVLMGKVVNFDLNLLETWLNVLDSITDQLNEETGNSQSTELSDTEREVDLHLQFPDHRLAFLERHDATEMNEVNDELVEMDTIGNLDSLALSDSFREVLCFLHQMLFGNNQNLIEDSYRIKMFRLCFNAVQKTNELFGNNCSNGDVFTTCAPGLIMALALISPSSKHIILRNSIFDGEIDFHRDPNPHESMKAAGPLRRLLAKVMQLLFIFPDNTILVEIARVCDRVSKLDLHKSSLGRVLIGLEMILKYAQDWEQHATVRVRLGDPLLEIGRLVTTWRKVELQSWAKLLSTREARFARRGREHWTRIHIILRRFVGTIKEEKILTSCIVTPRWAWKGIRQDVQKLTFYFPKGAEELYEIMKVLDTFCLTSPLGEFQARLELLRAFARQVNMEASISPKKHSLLQLSLSLHALWQYYNQFSVLIKSTLSNQRRPLETRLEQEIKLAKWDEQTYYAMAESTERNHRKLMNIIFEYDKVLVVNVMSCIDTELSKGVHSDLNSGADGIATIPEQMVLFPLESIGDQAYPEYRRPPIGMDVVRVWTDASQVSATQGRYFYKLSQLSKRMFALLEKPIDTLPNQGFNAVHDLCETIFERIELLRSEKTTRPMKERALTDLFKELKRQGYTPNKWSTPPEMQQISEIFQLPCPNAGFDHCPFIDPSLTGSSERYFQRCLAETYRFRAELSMYGSEHLTSRQLDMMHGFSEHGLYLVVQQRCIISCIVAQRLQLARMVDSITPLSGKGILLHQNVRKAAYTTFRNEFAYCLESLRQLVLLLKSSQHLLNATTQNWSNEAIVKIEAFVASVDIPPLLDDYAFVSSNEVDKIQSMKCDLEKALNTIILCREEAVLKECFPQAAFNECESQMSSVLESMNIFLCDVHSTEQCINETDTNVESFSNASYVAIEDAMLFTQSCLADIDANNIETQDLPGTPIWDLHHATANNWKALNVQNMIISVQSVLRELTEIHENASIDKRTRDVCTDFSCDIGHLYSIVLTLHDKILSRYMSFYRGTAKLQYIVLRVFRVLRAHGFCSSRSKEIDKQVNADGPTSGMTFEDDKDGTGMGEGDGKTDVTDQLENEEQLLGLKNDKEDTDSKKSPHDPKQLNKDEADQGMEMEGDFDGELYDIPDEVDVDADDDKDNTSDKEEVDREMGQDGSPNEQVIDEKLWDEDDDNGKQDTREEKFEQNSSVQGDGAADEMITKDESEGKEETKDMENRNDALQEKQNDIIEDDGLERINEDIEENYEDNRGVDVRDESQMNSEQDGINLDENIAIDEDSGEHDDEKDDHADVSDNEQERETVDDTKEPLVTDTDAESEHENDAEPVAESSSTFGEIQPHEDDCPDEELPKEENDLPKASLEEQKTQQSGLGVRDKDGGDALQEDTCEESDELQKDAEGRGTDDGSGKVDNSSGGGQGAGSAIGQNVSDVPEESSAQPESNEIPNPLKNPGDASKFWHRKLNVMTSLTELDNDAESMDDEVDDKNGEGTFEYSDEKQHNTTQTLGDADENNVMQLEQKQDDQENETVTKEITNSKENTEASRKADGRKKSTPGTEENHDRIEDTHIHESTNDVIDLENEVDEEENAITEDDIEQMDEEQDVVSENHVVSDLLQLRVEDNAVDLLNRSQAIVEIEQTTGHSTAEVSDALTRWSVIQSETHSLSRRLCEKLRLVMEPLVASKLRGDYRTGKRINMKRVIGYIASGYRKDKIWLRRTKPAKRNYRVLVAVDDSESMLKNGAGDMALKAMATLAVGMSQLEVGEVGIASFGNEMNLVHPFEQPFTSESGSNIIRSFQFKQQRTRTALCIESAMLALEGYHGEALQLVFMISDGRIERDSRSNIRKYIREMMEQNILLVLIIVEGSDSKKDSIMNMKEVTFDKGKPQFKHFIDDYPFPYYIVLNDMQSLPEVLGDALKQWFEMLARLQSNT